MSKVVKMKLYSLDEMLNAHVGNVGSKERRRYDKKLAKEMKRFGIRLGTNDGNLFDN